MTNTPPTVTDELSASLLERLGPAALVELTVFIAFANLSTRANTAGYRWLAARCDDGHRVTFEPVAEGTLVRLEHSGFERVPDAADALAGYDAGWKEVLGWYAAGMGSRPR